MPWRMPTQTMPAECSPVFSFRAPSYRPLSVRFWKLYLFVLIVLLPPGGRPNSRPAPFGRSIQGECPPYLNAETPPGGFRIAQVNRFTARHDGLCKPPRVRARIMSRTHNFISASNERA